MNAANPDRSTPGFTLVELVIVMGVISILMGLGIGYVRGAQNNMVLAKGILRDKIRLAHETSLRTHQPTSVQMLRRDEQTYVFAKVLSPAGQWHLEPGERHYARIAPDLTGIDEPLGRYGHAMRPDTSEELAMFTLETASSDRFNLIDGFAIKIELFMESREACVVVDWGEIRLELDQDLVPSAKMRIGKGVQRDSGDFIELQARDDQALALRRWVTLEIVHDGLKFRLLANGELLDMKPARGEPFQRKQRAELLVSTGNAPVPGRIDEIRVYAYERDELMALPADVILEVLPPILYDRNGKLSLPVEFDLVLGDRTEHLRVAPGGVIE